MLAGSQKLIDNHTNESSHKNQFVHVNKTGIHFAIVKLIDTYYKGDIDRFAASVHTTRTSAWMWYLGYSLPRFEIILTLCGQYALDIISFIVEGKLKRYGHHDFQLPQIVIPQKKVRRRLLNIARIRERLSNI